LALTKYRWGRLIFYRRLCADLLTLSEFCSDLRWGIEMIEFACCDIILLIGDALQNIGCGIDCHNDRIPIGVAGIRPSTSPP